MDTMVWPQVDAKEDTLPHPSYLTAKEAKIILEDLIVNYTNWVDKLGEDVLLDLIDRFDETCQHLDARFDPFSEIECYADMFGEER